MCVCALTGTGLRGGLRCAGGGGENLYYPVGSAVHTPDLTRKDMQRKIKRIESRRSDHSVDIYYSIGGQRIDRPSTQVRLNFDATIGWRQYVIKPMQ